MKPIRHRRSTAERLVERADRGSREWDASAWAKRPSQRARILSRLRLCSASNLDLSRISLKYTGRISELRAQGHRIVIVSQNRTTGRVVYRLVS